VENLIIESRFDLRLVACIKRSSWLYPVTVALKLLLTFPFILAFQQEAFSNQKIAAIQKKPGSNKTLKGVVIFSRHGVRVPHIDRNFALYADKPWPKWNLPAYYLTKHGYKLAKGMGVYYGQRYQVILKKHSNSCSIINKNLSRADNEQRTVMTAKALSEGVANNEKCGKNIFYMPYDVHDIPDPYFHPVPTVCKVAKIREKCRVVRPDTTEKLNRKIKRGIALIQSLTKCCDNSLCNGNTPCTLKSMPMHYTKGWLKGGLHAANAIAEAFILQKAQGFHKKNIAWGKLEKKDWVTINEYHTSIKKLQINNNCNAKREFSNITNYLLSALERVAFRHQVEKADITFIVGHDTDFDFMRKMLGLSWQLKGYAKNQVPPTAAWIFEIYEGENKKPEIKVFFVGQSLDQMNKGLEGGTKKGRPFTVPVHVKACYKSNRCFVSNFIKYGRERIDSQCVTPVF